MLGYRSVATLRPSSNHFHWHLGFLFPWCSSFSLSPPAPSCIYCLFFFIDSSSAITLYQTVKSYIYQFVLYYSHLSSVTSLMSLCLSLSQIYNKCLTKLFHTVLFSAVCVSQRHQTCMPHMMYWHCLIIEMLNKYLQMADPSSLSQAHKCNLWSVS